MINGWSALVGLAPRVEQVEVERVKARGPQRVAKPELWRSGQSWYAQSNIISEIK
jgi:hypothetical protein